MRSTSGFTGRRLSSSRSSASSRTRELVSVDREVVVRGVLLSEVLLGATGRRIVLWLRRGGVHKERGYSVRGDELCRRI